MAIKFVDEADLTTVGNAIRAKTGGSGLLTFPEGMAAAIAGIEAGADLPALTNPAGAGDIAAGKQAIRQDGGVVTGSVPTPNSVTLEDGTVEAGVSIGGGGVFLATGTMATDNLLRAGKTVQVSVAASEFGNAEAADVAAGKTFTSAAGLEATGTMPIIEAKIITLNCGQTHTIPAGCHSGSGKVKAASLASQTAGTAAAKDIASGKTAWVNGVKVTGSASASAITFDITNMTVRLTNLTGVPLSTTTGGTQIIEPLETQDLTGVNLLQGLDLAAAGGGTLSYSCTMQASGVLELVVMMV